MGGSADIIKAMRQAVPAGLAQLGQAQITVLRELTAELLKATPGADAEHRRFRDITLRGLCLPEAELASHIDGATILVTGGTGCIGSALMAELAARRPARLVSVSRGGAESAPGTPARPRQHSAEYLKADVSDCRAIDAVIGDVRPDIVFHLAAQRSPALAEVEVHRTVSTNTLGARNVLAAGAKAGTRQVVLASTGKAVRPYSPEVYTASKRAAEWVATTAACDVTCSAARFTHVVDNSIVYQRLLGWAADGPASGTASGNDVIRLHSGDIAFYAQSACESAQLLLIAMLGAVPGEFRVHAISDLGWPISLLDIALGILADTRSSTPLYISGYDPGYEEVPFPGLYDPVTSGDVSPLLNAFEATVTTPGPCPMVNSFRLEMAPDPAAPKLLDVLDRACARTRDNDAIRHALDDLSWSVLDAALAAADLSALRRSAMLTRRFEDGMTPAHRKIMRAITAHCGWDPYGTD
ncbi:MAG TPA: SDR family NAD(P)-dependent oxidoreductase [Trebonia sp.]|nr:SDR family NAD(P)-dependent oxidoreductase [Trebonia sp.]